MQLSLQIVKPQRNHGKRNKTSVTELIFSAKWQIVFQRNFPFRSVEEFQNNKNFKKCSSKKPKKNSRSLLEAFASKQKFELTGKN